MSMAEPFLPNHSSKSDEIAAADAGNGAPEAEFTEEPDVLAEGATNETGGAEAKQDPPFRTPVAGERLSPEDLAAES